MNWQIIWQELGLRGWMFFLLVLCIVATLLYYSLMRSALKNYFRRFSKPDKNRPARVHLRVGDDLSLILERIWFRGQWRYLVQGELPYRFGSSESKEKISQLEIPKCLRDKPEEQWLKNLDALTKPGGGYEEAVKSYYDQPKQVARRRVEEKLFGEEMANRIAGPAL